MDFRHIKVSKLVRIGRVASGVLFEIAITLLTLVLMPVVCFLVLSWMAK
ncbi:MAG: hypothetical protein ABH825_01885 [Candidatus Omnitrophota bacterium]